MAKLKSMCIKEVILECLKCGNNQSIWRKTGKLKEVGHNKNLYCIKCKDTTLHEEISYY